MKKATLSAIIFLLISTSVYSQLTYVPDNNFEQALIDLGYDTPPLDDYVPTANIETVTELDIHGLSISDLTGIEDFVSLTHLNCVNNFLSSIDVSQNIALINLHCDLNFLTTLNVTQNSALVILTCGYNTFPVLDVSQNILLQTLITSGNNQLSSIDLSQNTLLKGFFCIANQLTSIDVTQNPNLEFLYCQQNLLTEIDVSQNPLLQGLHADYNQLTELDVSQNPDLYILTCDGNGLTNLDVRNGNNSNVTDENYSSLFNPNLTCVFVDDADYSNSNWANIEANSTFVETQAECDALAVSDFKESNFNIYPNPVKSTLNIETNTPFSKVKIYTLLWQKVLESTAKSMDVSSLTTGLYIMVIEGESGTTMVKRFIKQ